jgi:hypothetical protein
VPKRIFTDCILVYTAYILRMNVYTRISKRMWRHILPKHDSPTPISKLISFSMFPHVSRLEITRSVAGIDVRGNGCLRNCGMPLTNPCRLHVTDTGDGTRHYVFAHTQQSPGVCTHICMCTHVVAQGQNETPFLFVVMPCAVRLTPMTPTKRTLCRIADWDRGV